MEAATAALSAVPGVMHRTPPVDDVDDEDVDVDVEDESDVDEGAVTVPAGDATAAGATNSTPDAIVV